MIKYLGCLEEYKRVSSIRYWILRTEYRVTSESRHMGRFEEHKKYQVFGVEKKNRVDRVTSESRHMGCFGERKEVFEVCLMLLTGRQSINTRVGLIRSVQLQTGFENFFRSFQTSDKIWRNRIWRNRKDTNCWRLIAFRTIPRKLSSHAIAMLGSHGDKMGESWLQRVVWIFPLPTQLTCPRQHQSSLSLELLIRAKEDRWMEEYAQMLPSLEIKM